MTVEAAHAEYVSALANGIKAHYGKNEVPTEPLEDSLQRMQRAGL